MYGYIYKTTNLINNKIYIGQHKANKFTEEYKGSGIHLKRAFQKDGFENFKVELIEECFDKDNLNEKEVYWIKYYRELLGNENLYNIKNGGQYGHCMKDKHHSEESKLKSSIANKGQKRSKLTRQRLKENHANINGPNNPFFGKKHSEETKKLLAEKCKDNCKGSKWMNKNNKCKLVKQELVEKYLKDNWKFGRITMIGNKYNRNCK